MPGWHEATKELQAAGKLRMVGIIQEQHPERCRLFMQWKQMDWPVLVDSLDLLDVSVVPITVLVDEHGIVRETGLRAAGARAAVERFLATDYTAPETSLAASKETLPPREYGDALALWGGPTRRDEALAAYASAGDEDARALFRSGVIRRMRYDDGGEEEEFTGAVAAWSRALELDPNNYIWRRRLQQFGPRLEKPYPFYDWIDTAVAEVSARGESPVALTVAPGGAELAQPAREFQAAPPAEAPDPQGKIHRDAGRFVRVQATQVPRVVKPGETARVHLEFRPATAADAHWNNEAGGLTVWLEPRAGWQVDRRRMVVDPVSSRASDERRRVEFEVQAPDGDASAPALEGYALYYVCEGVRGACLYRRQDLRLDLIQATQ